MNATAVLRCFMKLEFVGVEILGFVVVLLLFYFPLNNLSKYGCSMASLAVSRSAGS